jgi:hypothetical protein
MFRPGSAFRSRDADKTVFGRCDANNFSCIAATLKALNSNLAGLEKAHIVKMGKAHTVLMEGAGSAVTSRIPLWQGPSDSLKTLDSEKVHLIAFIGLHRSSAKGVSATLLLRRS